MQAFWEIVVSNALIATFLAIATALLSRVWKNPAAIHLLWVVVLLKLFTPPILTTGIPLPTQWRLTMSDDNSSVKPPLTLADTVLQHSALADAPAVPTSTLPRNAANRDLGANQQPTAWAAFAPRAWSLSSILLGIWLAGSLGIALRQTLSIRRFALLLRGAEPPEEAITTKARQLGNHLGLSRIPTIGMSPAVLPPLVWSVGGPPRVILPTALLDATADFDRCAQATALAARAGDPYGWSASRSTPDKYVYSRSHSRWALRRLYRPAGIVAAKGRLLPDEPRNVALVAKSVTYPVLLSAASE